MSFTPLEAHALLSTVNSSNDDAAQPSKRCLVDFSSVAEGGKSYESGNCIGVGGFSRDPLYGGAGDQTLAQLGVGQVYAKLVPEGANNFSMTVSIEGRRVFVIAPTLNPGEAVYLAPDTDNDQLTDGWELEYFHSVSNALPHVDSDGDGFTNDQEARAGTDPTNAASRLVITMASVNAGSSNAVLRWQSAPNKQYAIGWATNLYTSFIDFTNVPATPPLNTFTDAAHEVDTHFYRIRLQE